MSRRSQAPAFSVRVWSVLGAILAGALLAAPTANAFSVGAGGKPGLAVDAAGTAYIAWNGPEPINASLRFCRLPRGARACDAGAAPVIPTDPNSTSLSRPFVVVSGARVVIVQYRYPTSGAAVTRAGTYRFTSTDGGASFGAGELVGTVTFEEAVVGPGDTLSGVPLNGEMSFQNVVLGSPAPVNADGTSAVPRALLSTTHQNWATVGLIDAATPLAVFTADVAAQFRRYTGSGDLNDAANWTAPLDIGLAAYPKLAGGPNGLMLLAGDNKGGLFARKWNGSGFGPRVTIGPGSAPYAHLFQDAGGRLHAVFQRDSADPLHVIHAVSDDGTTWRSGTLATQDIATDGGIDSLRVATAADHIGVAVWHAGKGAGDIRVSAVGPDAPAPVTVNGSARADDLAGTRLADRLFGRAGNDRLRGLAGNDLLAGGPGNDLLIGGPGNDVLIGGPGRDSFIALAGNDTIDSRDGVAESVLCGPGRDTVRADRADRLIGCEVIRRA